MKYPNCEYIYMYIIAFDIGNLALAEVKQKTMYRKYEMYYLGRKAK